MQVPYRLTNLAEVESLVSLDDELYVDTETDGIYGTIRLAQFYQTDWDEVLLVDKPDPFSLTIFLGKTKNVAHNIHYEVTVCQQNTNTTIVPDRMHDTFLLARLAFPHKESFTLDDVMVYCLGYDPYTRQGLDKKELQKSNWGAPYLTKSQLTYAATDVYYLPQVFAKVRKAELEFSYKLDMLTLNYCLDFQWNGMPLDSKRFALEYRKAQANVNEWSKDCPVNVNSWKQVREWLKIDKSDDLTLAYLELDTDEPRRFELCRYDGVTMPLHEAAGLIRKIRKERKKISFLEKFEKTVTSDGNILGKFKPSARSGRLTSDDQNLQQIPRSLKCVFGLPEDGDEIMLYADYAQIELRHICAITGCRNMEKLFREGRDLHSYTTDMLFQTYDDMFEDALAAATQDLPAGATADMYAELNNRVASEVKKAYKYNRTISKTYTFSSLYAGSVKMIMGILIKDAGVVLSEREATKIRAKWRNLWKEIYAWQERGLNAWKNGRLGSTPLGRKYKAKLYTDQLNIENQGGAADVNKLAMHYLVPRLREYNAKHGTNWRIADNIHDSFILRGSSDPEHYQAVGKILANSMQEAWFECSKALKIKDLPMPVDVIAGYNWGDIETDDFEHPWTYSLEPYANYKAA